MPLDSLDFEAAVQLIADKRAKGPAPKRTAKKAPAKKKDCRKENNDEEDSGKEEGDTVQGWESFVEESQDRRD